MTPYGVTRPQLVKKYTQTKLKLYPLLLIYGTIAVIFFPWGWLCQNFDENEVLLIVIIFIHIAFTMG